MEEIKNMLASHLSIFIVATFVAVIITVYLMEEKPVLSIPFIFLGLIGSVICTYGMWSVEYLMVLSDDSVVVESLNYGEPYSYVFVFTFFLFFLFFFRAGFNMWKEALATKGEFDYSDFDYQKGKKYYR